jgi:hypothetical protein
MTISKLIESADWHKDDNNCSVTAVAIACDLSYDDAYKLCESEGRKRGKGMKSWAIRKACEHHVDLHYSKFKSYKGRQFRTFFYNEAEFLDDHIVLVLIKDHIVAINQCIIQDFETTDTSRSIIRQIWVVYPKGQKPEEERRVFSFHNL